MASWPSSQSSHTQFVSSWQEVLDLHPKLEYFKINEAGGLRGQFAGFSSEQRDLRLNQFIDVILQCDPWEVLYPVLPKTRSSPYYSAFIAMVTAFSGF